MRLLTHLILGHVRGRSHGPTLAAQHGVGASGLWRWAVVEVETVGMLVRGAGIDLRY